ncbi:tail fiber protein [Buttiauxella sp. B2]|uniref:tail fiber protein n=1 Tax=Buttiauxella sp. B2 TaxID=2587812 RepID=UPI00167B4017|nr:tail fiber protein [Buttiauxella sp. B2]
MQSYRSGLSFKWWLEQPSHKTAWINHHMEQHFFRTPWAANGDKAAISETNNPDGTVSFNEGWGLDYEKDMDADAHAKAVERDAMNGILNAITVALRQYQTGAFPEFITAADNGGAAFAYGVGTVVRYRVTADVAFKSYVSLVDGNTAVPGGDTTQWQEFIYAEASDADTATGQSGVLIITPRRLKKVTDELQDKIEESINTSVTPFILPVGAIVMWGATVPPDGWIEVNGQAFNTADNPELFKLYPAGQVPDWRGRFVRAWDNGAGVDPDGGRGIGSEQFSAFEKHSHSAPLERSNDGLTGPQVIRGVYWPGKYTRITTNAGTSEEGAAETRPRNIAAMYIIKTDQAEEQDGAEYPTAIVVSPATGTIQAGSLRKFTGTILPASIAGGYVITWSIADATLGSIDASGMYTSTAGEAGEQTVIATVKTDNGTVTGTAIVTQNIWLTKIGLVVPDKMNEGESITAGLTFTPTNYTESVQYSSSDSSVLTFIEGDVEARGAGTATISVTGVYSGVVASKTIKVLPVEVVEEYLRIDANLSEIADAGEEDQQEARDNLGLGKLATKDSLEAADVGAVPQAKDSLPAETDLNSLTVPGDYFQNVSSSATAELNYPEEVAGALRVVGTGVDEGACRQFYWPYNSDKEYRRFAFGEPLEFSAWGEY